MIIKIGRNIILNEWEHLSGEDYCRTKNFYHDDGTIHEITTIYLQKKSKIWIPIFWEPLFFCNKLCDEYYFDSCFAKQHIDQLLVKISNLSSFM
jgi:hypothetical protein